jgi:acyl-CoA thioester hydrolase
MISSEITYRVLYAHTDIMGVANNERYLEYFEAGRNELLRTTGYSYKEMENENIGLPVIEAHCKYIKPAYYDDIIKIKAYLKDLPTVRMKIDYELFVEDKLIAEGYTIHSFVKLTGLKPVRPPEHFLKLLKSKI